MSDDVPRARDRCATKTPDPSAADCCDPSVPESLDPYPATHPDPPGKGRRSQRSARSAIRPTRHRSASEPPSSNGALVAYRRRDGRYDLRDGPRWNVDRRLVDAIGETTPFGRGLVDAGRVARRVPFDRLLVRHLDPRIHGALYLVSPSFDVEPYRVWRLDVGTARDPRGSRDRVRGALVETGPGPRDRELATWFGATSSVLADAVEMGVLSHRAASAHLEALVCEERRGRVYTYLGDETDPERRG